MKKREKKLIIFNLFLIISFCTIAMPNYVLAYDPGLDGYEYTNVSNVTNQTTSFTHIAENKVSIEQNVSYSATRTKSSETNVSASLELEALKAKLTFGVEVSWGSSFSVTETVSFNIPGSSKVKCEYGPCYVRNSGTLNYYRLGKLSSTKSIYAYYTYASWSRIQKI